MSIFIQYIVIFVVIAVSVCFVLRNLYKAIYHNVKCKDYKCAGCAFYDKCKKVEKKQWIYLVKLFFYITFATAIRKRNGTLADRLGNGLQNRVEQFDSARYLF